MSSSPATPAKAPKTMSSRLMTMKFMQRAAGSSPISSPSIAGEPSPKRQKTGESTPTDRRDDLVTDNAALQATLAQEEAKRQAILDRQAAEAGDTHWVLNFGKISEPSTYRGKPILRVVHSSYSAIDNNSVANSNDEEAIVGRRSFGKFKGNLGNQDGAESSETSDSEDGDSTSNSESDSEDDDLSDQDDAVNDLIKTEQKEVAQKLRDKRRKKRKSDEAVSRKLAKSRKKKEIKLNKLTSISGGNNHARPVSKPPPKQTCYHCGQVGHIRLECPQFTEEQQNGRPTKKARKA